MLEGRAYCSAWAGLVWLCSKDIFTIDDLDASQGFNPGNLFTQQNKYSISPSWLSWVNRNSNDSRMMLLRFWML